MSEVVLVGLASNLDGEERALAHLKVSHNGMEYDWHVWVPAIVTDLGAFVDSVSQSVLDDIDAKEAAWIALEPKTKTLDDPMTGQTMEVPIDKGEVVRADAQDYYAKRRREYPSLSDQLDALWKGADSQAFAEMRSRIMAVKAKYPKR